MQTKDNEKMRETAAKAAEAKTPEELEAEVRDLAPEDLEKAAGGSRMLLSAESGNGVQPQAIL